MEWHPVQGVLAILLVASCYRNRVKLWPYGPLGIVALDQGHTIKNSMSCLVKSNNVKDVLIIKYESNSEEHPRVFDCNILDLFRGCSWLAV